MAIGLADVSAVGAGVSVTVEAGALDAEVIHVASATLMRAQQRERLTAPTGREFS